MQQVFTNRGGSLRQEAAANAKNGQYPWIHKKLLMALIIRVNIISVAIRMQAMGR